MLPEYGYTPANLRALLASAGLTQQAAADLLSDDKHIVHSRTIRKWLAEVGTTTHRDMPLSQWMRLSSAIQGRESAPPDQD